MEADGNSSGAGPVSQDPRSCIGSLLRLRRHQGEQERVVLAQPAAEWRQTCVLRSKCPANTITKNKPTADT
jgi:hypothetical protein